MPIPDILQSVPTEPTDFCQGYILPESDETDLYRVVFAWEDKSNTETGFEIQLLDVTDYDEITFVSENNEATWKKVSESKISSYSKGFKGGSNWYAGGLERNSTSAVFYLPLGKRYLARIRSVNNDVGSSPWCYAESEKVSVTIPAGEATKDSLVLPDSKTIKGSAFSSPIINLFRISYNLVGGSFTPSIDRIYYFEQIDGGIPILTPNGDSMNGRNTYKNLPVLLSSAKGDWLYWAISGIDGDKYPKEYTQCTSPSDYDATATYYQPSKTEKDVNGMN